jgi:hypothetical protein
VAEQNNDKDLKDLEKYFADKIKESFPQLKIKSFYAYDRQGDDFVGVFTEDNGMLYSFLINKGKSSPILQRVG